MWTKGQQNSLKFDFCFVGNTNYTGAQFPWKITFFCSHKSAFCNVRCYNENIFVEGIFHGLLNIKLCLHLPQINFPRKLHVSFGNSLLGFAVKKLGAVGPSCECTYIQNKNTQLYTVYGNIQSKIYNLETSCNKCSRKRTTIVGTCES